jgi:hypothetical protein
LRVPAPAPATRKAGIAGFFARGIRESRERDSRPTSLVLHWKGKFKWIKQDNAAYQMANKEWELIRRLTMEVMHTIPLAFVGTIPNIHKDMGLYKAEAYSFWFIYLAPILLNG